MTTVDRLLLNYSVTAQMRQKLLKSYTSGEDLKMLKDNVDYWGSGLRQLVPTKKGIIIPAVFFGLIDVWIITWLLLLLVDGAERERRKNIWNPFDVGLENRRLNWHGRDDRLPIIRIFSISPQFPSSKQYD